MSFIPGAIGVPSQFPDGILNLTAFTGTTPEPGGTTPFQLTTTNRRVQSIAPTANIEVRLPSSGVISGEEWDIINRSATYTITVKTYNGTATVGVVNPVSTGAFTALVGAPVNAGDWSVQSLLSSGQVLNGGNSFGAGMVIGTNDAQSVVIKTNGLAAVTIASGGAATFATSVSTPLLINGAAGNIIGLTHGTNSTNGLQQLIRGQDILLSTCTAGAVPIGLHVSSANGYYPHVAYNAKWASGTSTITMSRDASDTVAVMVFGKDGINTANTCFGFHGAAVGTGDVTLSASTLFMSCSTTGAWTFGNTAVAAGDVDHFFYVGNNQGGSVRVRTSAALADGKYCSINVASGTTFGVLVSAYKRTGSSAYCGTLQVMQEDAEAQAIWCFNRKLYISQTVGNAGSSTGTVVGDQTSDIRVKTNIQPSEYGLPEVLQITPISYTLDGEKRIGFPAQTIQTLMPELVYNSGEISELTPDGKLVMRNGNDLTSVLWSAVKELNAKVEALSTEITLLKGGNP